MDTSDTSRRSPWLVNITHEREFYFVNPSKAELGSTKQIGIKLRRG